MNDLILEIWLYLTAAFSIGAGVAWWLRGRLSERDLTEIEQRWQDFARSKESDVQALQKRLELDRASDDPAKSELRGRRPSRSL